MIARVDVRLRREALRTLVRGTVRRRVAEHALDALSAGEAARSIPEEKLTTTDVRSGYHAVYDTVHKRDPGSQED